MITCSEGSGNRACCRLVAPEPFRRVSSPPVNKIEEVHRLISASSDRNNPSAEAVIDMLRASQRVAVIGLSRDPLKPARRVPSYLAAKGYDVIPVNPNADRILGKKAYADLDQVPGPVDLVVVFRPSEVAGPFVEAAVERRDEPAIWLQTGIRSDEAIEAARAAGRFAVQDLCIFRVHRALED